MNSQIEIERAIQKVVRSPKYTNIDPDFVRWVILREASHHKKFDDVVKASRSRLHQAASSYFRNRPDYPSLLSELNKLPREITHPQVMAWVKKCLRAHASSFERLPLLDSFYHKIFSHLPRVKSILDFGCGLNPMAIGWMPQPESYEYKALDIYRDQSDFLNSFFDHCGLNATALVQNIMDLIKPTSADVVFLLKILPILDQLKKNASVTIFERIDAPNLVVSYPVTSLGGRDKGMRDHYAQQFGGIATHFSWSVDRIDFSSEIVFIARR